MAGGQHHHRTNIDKYHPGYFGKVGMRYFRKTQNQFWKPTINLEKVSTMIAGSLLEEGYGISALSMDFEGSITDRFCLYRSGH